MKKLLMLFMRKRIHGAGRRTRSTSSNLADLFINAKITDGLDEWIMNKGYRDSDVSIEDLANTLNVDRQQLVHYFKYVIGTSFTQWRKHMRIEDAKILLVQTNLSCAEIGSLVGFSDKSNFRKRFEDVTGKTPSEWRNINGCRTGVQDRTSSRELQAVRE